MKKPVLVLLALLALIPLAPSMAQTPVAPSAATPVPDAATPVPDAATAQFLATLSGGQGQAPATNDLAPAPSFMTGCTSNSQCPAGQLCCYPCGADLDNCTKTCLQAVKGRCPLFV